MFKQRQALSGKVAVQQGWEAADTSFKPLGVLPLWVRNVFAKTRELPPCKWGQKGWSVTYKNCFFSAHFESGAIEF